MIRIVRREFTKISILYRSGYVFTGYFRDFEYSDQGGTRKMSWTSENENHRPLVAGIDDIVAIFKVGSKVKWGWEWTKNSDH